MQRVFKAAVRVVVCGLAIVLLGQAQVLGADKVRVAVSIPPQKYLLSRIGGERVSVEVLLPPGANPTTYEPKPSQLRNISRVSSYFPIGIPVESAWLDRLRGVNADMRIAPMYEGIERFPMPRTYEEALQPGAEKDAVSGRGHPDPHIWLAPPLVRILAQNAREEMIRLDPDNASVYRTNYAKLARNINELDNELLDLFADVENRFFLAFHPAWGYFARAYGLTQIPVKLAGKKLTARRMNQVIRIAENKDLQTVFYQPQFSGRPPEQVASNLEEGEAVGLDPLAEDWADNLRECARSIRKALD